jgi:hypothetical protein
MSLLQRQIRIRSKAMLWLWLALGREPPLIPIPLTAKTEEAANYPETEIVSGFGRTLFCTPCLN